MHKLTTALITPFDSDLQIDYQALSLLLKTQLDNNITSFVVNGTTAEAPTLSLSEKRNILEFVIKNTPAQTEIIVGVSSNSTIKVIEEIQNVDDLEFSTYMICPPYYNKTSEEGLIMHFLSAFNITDKDFMLYNIPSRCGMEISLNVIEQLLITNRLVAIKEASADMSYLSSLIQKYQGQIDIYNGNDDLILPCYSLGCSGIISAISNAIPNEFASLNNLLITDNIVIARKKFYEISSLINLTYDYVNPIGVKALAQINLGIKDYLRLPLVSAPSSYKQELKELL